MQLVHLPKSAMFKFGFMSNKTHMVSTLKGIVFIVRVQYLYQ